MNEKENAPDIPEELQEAILISLYGYPPGAKGDKECGEIITNTFNAAIRGELLDLQQEERGSKIIELDVDHSRGEIANSKDMSYNVTLRGTYATIIPGLAMIIDAIMQYAVTTSAKELLNYMEKKEEEAISYDDIIDTAAYAATVIDTHVHSVVKLALEKGYKSALDRITDVERNGDNE